MNVIELIELPENNVKSITVDAAENIWIGTNSNGIYVLTKVVNCIRLSWIIMIRDPEQF
jgi:ligand-binding sensor domain-containing protein